MPKCICPDWRDNINKLDAPIVLAAIRNGRSGYTGKRFTHCPWCGSELTLEASDYGKQLVTDAMVDRFLAWPLPKSVCSDLCVTDSNYPHPRSGTCLLTAVEARAMLEYVLQQSPEPK